MRFLVRRRSLVVATVLLVMITVLYMLPRKQRTFPAQASQQSGRAGERRKQYEYVDKKGIRVIVGHYKADDKPGINFTAAELNTNNFSPEEGVA